MANPQHNIQLSDFVEQGEASIQLDNKPNPMIEHEIEECDIVPGHIVYLPEKQDLPLDSVTRAHGPGFVDDAIHGRPVVIVSRPQDRSLEAHFMLITSLQGRRLEQVYGKQNDYDKGHRSWYLPIAPTPKHPDATSNRARKRYPTLSLSNSVTLRTDSYVNARHIFSIQWQHLQPFGLSKDLEVFIKLHADSLVQLLKASKTLTSYEPGPQYEIPGAGKSVPRRAIRRSRALRRQEQEAEQTESFSMKRELSTQPEAACSHSNTAKSDFRRTEYSIARLVGPPPKVPPDTIILDVQEIGDRPFFRCNVEDARRTMGIPFDVVAIRKPLDKLWVDTKGVAAIVIASI